MPRQTRRPRSKPEPRPDDLIRVEAGRYRSGDGRFEVEKSDLGWYLVDGQEANEFGQQLIHGPFATLDAVRSAVPGARELKPMLRVRARASRKQAKRMATARPVPPPSWLDRLPAAEAADVRRLIRVLELEGIDHAEDLVRKDRLANTPLVAVALIEHRLRALIDKAVKDDKGALETVVQRTVEILTEAGMRTVPPLPRWELLEVGPVDAGRPRRLRPKL